MDDTGISLTIRWDDLHRALAEAPERLLAEVEKEFKLHGAHVISRVRKERIVSRSGEANQPALDDRLTSRTGFLRGSFRYDVSGHSTEDLELRVLTTAPYAAKHEFGYPPMPARLGFRRVWDESSERLSRMIDRAIGRALAGGAT